MFHKIICQTENPETMKNQPHFGDTERIDQLFIAPSDVTFEDLGYLYARFNLRSSISHDNLSLGKN